MADGAADLLPELDRSFLGQKGWAWEILPEGGTIHVVVCDFEFPDPYTPRRADLLIILPAGFPNASPDMFWTSPDVKLRGAGSPQAADHHETFRQRTWQRWSRHFNLGWRPGVDGIRNYIAAIRKELSKGL